MQTDWAPEGGGWGLRSQEDAAFMASLLKAVATLRFQGFYFQEFKCFERAVTCRSTAWDLVASGSSSRHVLSCCKAKVTTKGLKLPGSSADRLF